MEHIITGIGIGFGIITAVLAVLSVIVIIASAIIKIADGPIGNIAYRLSTGNNGLTDGQIKKIKRWMFFSPKKITLLDRYLSFGMTVVGAYNKVDDKK